MVRSHLIIQIQKGIDDFYGFTSGHWGNYFDAMLEHNGKIVKGHGFLTDDFNQRGLEFIDSKRTVLSVSTVQHAA